MGVDSSVVGKACLNKSLFHLHISNAGLKWAINVVFICSFLNAAIYYIFSPKVSNQFGSDEASLSHFEKASNMSFSFGCRYAMQLQWPR